MRVLTSYERTFKNIQTITKIVVARNLNDRQWQKKRMMNIRPWNFSELVRILKTMIVKQVQT